MSSPHAPSHPPCAAPAASPLSFFLRWLLLLFLTRHHLAFIAFRVFRVVVPHDCPEQKVQSQSTPSLAFGPSLPPTSLLVHLPTIHCAHDLSLPPRRRDAHQAVFKVPPKVGSLAGAVLLKSKKRGSGGTSPTPKPEPAPAPASAMELSSEEKAAQAAAKAKKVREETDAIVVKVRVPAGAHATRTCMVHAHTKHAHTHALASRAANS